MGNLIFKKGDLFTSTSQAIGHGCNTKGLMVAGIAVQFKNRYESMFYAYKWLCEAGRLEPGTVFPYYAAETDRRVIYNIASQENPGANAEAVLLYRGLVETFQHMQRNGLNTLGLPAIGAGIGGLERDSVIYAIDRALDGFEITVEFWEL